MGKTLKEGGRELRLEAWEAVKERIYTLYADEGEILHPDWQGGRQRQNRQQQQRQ